MNQESRNLLTTLVTTLLRGFIYIFVASGLASGVFLLRGTVLNPLNFGLRYFAVIGTIICVLESFFGAVLTVRNMLLQRPVFSNESGTVFTDLLAWIILLSICFTLLLGLSAPELFRL
jgi:hypothetical protein